MTAGFSTILITGGSAGIGAGLARAFAAPGTRLALVGRNAERLSAVAAACRARGAAVDTAALDLTHRDPVAAQMARWDDAAPFDLVIAGAGIAAGGTDHALEELAAWRDITATNVAGFVNVLEPLIPRLVGRGRGQIGLVSSLAGLRGLPGAPAYCASKAWARVLGESLRLDLAPHGIGVSVICPGFVRTGMTAANRFPMPFLMEADQAAARIRRGLLTNRARIAFPWPMVAGLGLLNALPAAWGDWLLRRLGPAPADPGRPGRKSR